MASSAGLSGSLSGPDPQLLSFEAFGLSFSCVSAAPPASAVPQQGAAPLAVLLLPRPLEAGALVRLQGASGCSIAAVCGNNWNADFTPWQAPGVGAADPPFSAGAPAFLHLLTQQALPLLSSRLSLPASAPRFLVGYSLSGLFSLWAMTRTSAFSGSASISGSFWYDGFSSWFSGSVGLVRPSCRVYLSLGRKEGCKGYKRFSSIRQDTAAISSLLSAHGVECCFNTVAGGHFDDVAPRAMAALQWLCAGSVG